MQLRVEQENTRVKKIVEQYTTATTAMERMFTEARLRTDEDSWRSNQVGSCTAINNKSQAESGLIGPARDRLIELRDRRNAQTSGKSELTGCPNHRTCGGCTLGELKSPTCIAFFENRGEWARRFGIDTTEVTSDSHESLREILLGRALYNEEILIGFVERIETNTDRIKLEPILHQPVLNKKTWRDIARLGWEKAKSLPRDIRRGIQTRD